MGNTMSMSLSEAATAVGMYKSSVLRAIKAGKVSAVPFGLARLAIAGQR
jgi:DNA-directed RNA polymerase specialized sigma54-like protein